MMNMVFKFPSENEIKEMRIGMTPIEDIIAESKAIVKIPSTGTFSGELTYVNKAFLYYMAYASCDDDGYEYPYNLFDLAQDPSIIQKIMEAAW
jgi:hypothetical protein